MRALVVASLVFTTTIARADGTPAGAELRGAHLSLTKATHSRDVGIALVVVGIVLSGVGAGFAIADRWNDSLSYQTIFNTTAGTMIPGALAIGAGATLWGIGDYERRRALGLAPMPTPEHRARRGARLTKIGAALVGGGSALAVGSIIAGAIMGARGNHDDFYYPMLAASVLGACSSVALGAGIPVLATGLSDRRTARQGGSLAFDGIAPQAGPHGGGLAISGRF